MPKTGEEENHEGITNHFRFANTRATKGNINIIAEPRCERNVPTPPELRYISAKIRIIEVPHQFDTEEFGGTDSNIRITGEIAIDLESKENSSKE